MTVQAQQRLSIGVDYSGSAAYLGVVTKDYCLAQQEFRLADSPHAFKHAVEHYLFEVCRLNDVWPEFWIEQPFVSGARFPQVALKLVRTATILEVAALDAGIEPMFVHPGTWRKEVYGPGKIDDKKERARQAAKDILGFEPKFKNQHNICEGMLIAYYGHLQHYPEDKPVSAGLRNLK